MAPANSTYKIIFSILYFFFTAVFLHAIIEVVFNILAGQQTVSNYVQVVVYAVIIFVLPLIFSPKNAQKLSDRSIKKPETDEELKIKIYKTVNLDVKPLVDDIIKKCSKCGFDNPAHALECMNCGRKLN